MNKSLMVTGKTICLFQQEVKTMELEAIMPIPGCNISQISSLNNEIKHLSADDGSVVPGVLKLCDGTVCCL